MRGSHELAAPLWGAAGTIGVAVGPRCGRPADRAVQLAVDLPRPAAAAPAGPGRRSDAELPPPEPGREGELDLRPEAGLALLSAGLTGALFLLVILLTEGWGLSPIAAAATVSMIPAGRLRGPLGRPTAPGRPPRRRLAGGIAIAGGLGRARGPARGVVGADAAAAAPDRDRAGARPPGATLAAVGGRDPEGSRASATIAARHAGIVVGILALAPILSAQLDSQRLAAQDSTTALLSTRRCRRRRRSSLATALGDGIEAADGRLPDVGPAFDAVTPAAGDEARLRAARGGHRRSDRAGGDERVQPALPGRRRASPLLALVPIARLGPRTGGARWAIAAEPR